MANNKAKLRRKRKSKTQEQTSSFQSIKKIQCPQCKRLVPDFNIESIRGQTKCIKCHIEDTWCYTEENRRTQMRMIDELLSVDWKAKRK